MDNGANIGAEDAEGNTCLHVKCYGEIEKDTQGDCIELLLQREASAERRNNRVSVYTHTHTNTHISIL